jgi:hypothetical protein
MTSSGPVDENSREGRAAPVPRAADEASDLRALAIRAALDELESEMTHVLKNPLAGMVLSSTRIRRMVAALPGQDKLASVCDHLCDAVNKLNEGVTRFDGLEIMPVPSPHEASPRAVLDEAIELVHNHARLALSPVATEELPPVRVDPAFVRAALTSLIELGVSGATPARSLPVAAWHDGEERVYIDIGPEMSRATFEGRPDMLRPVKQGRLDRLGVGIARRLLEVTGAGLAVDEVDGVLRARVMLPVVHRRQHHENERSE